MTHVTGQTGRVSSSRHFFDHSQAIYHQLVIDGLRSGRLQEEPIFEFEVGKETPKSPAENMPKPSQRLSPEATLDVQEEAKNIRFIPKLLRMLSSRLRPTQKDEVFAVETSSRKADEGLLARTVLESVVVVRGGALWMERRPVLPTPRGPRSDIDWWPKNPSKKGALPFTTTAKMPLPATPHHVPITLRRHRPHHPQPPAPFTASARREARVSSLCPGIGTPAARSLFRIRMRAEVLQPPRAVSSLSRVASEAPPLKLTNIVTCGEQATSSRRPSIAAQGDKHLAGWGEWEKEFRVRAEELATVTRERDLH